MDTPTEWYKNLPVLTRIMITATAGFSMLFFIGLLNPAHIALDFYKSTSYLQVWRFFTHFFFNGPFSLPWLFSMYLFRLERNEMFSRSSGDYLTFLLFSMATINLASLLLPFPAPFLGSSLSFAIIYYWSKREPFARMVYWGFTIQASQFPFYLLGFSFLMGNSIWLDVLGLLSGHLFYFLREVVPAEYNRTLIFTPTWLHKAAAFISDKLGPAGAAAAAQQAAAQQQRDNRGVFQGRAYRLG